MSGEITNADIFQEIKTSRAELRAAITASESRLLLQLESSNRRILQLETENKVLEKRLQYFDRFTRANNIIIRGLTLPEKVEVPRFVVGELNNLLGVQLDLRELNNAYTVGKYSTSAVVKVEFISRLRKEEVLRCSSKLKGTAIYIRPDLSLEERKRDAVLRDRLKAERAKGNRCYISKGKLYVSEQVYTAENILETSDITSRVRPGSEPSSLLSTPEAQSCRIFKTHRIVQDQALLNREAEKSETVAESSQSLLSEVAAGADCRVGEDLKETGASQVSDHREEPTQKERKNLELPRTRKGSGSNSRATKRH